MTCLCLIGSATSSSLHAEVGLRTIPTLIVGHMSGQNWDPAWRAGRDLYRDVWLVSEQAWYAAEITRRFGAHPSVAGWLISNEMPLYGGPATTDEITAWARILVQAVRSGGATQPVSLGDGAWGVEVTGIDNGYSLRALAPIVDFIGPHVYPALDDQVRQFLKAAFGCELAGSFGKPVILEEFGLSSDLVSEDNAAAYYRQVLYTTLLAGCRGWIAWNNCDYDNLRDEDPYRHHPFEIHFGLTDSKGRPKPQLIEVQRFAEKLAELAPDGWETTAGEAAIVVPEHFEHVLPFTIQQFREDMGDDLLQSYVAAKEADLPVSLVRERDGLPAGARLYLVPSAKLITAPGAHRLRQLAEGGATVYTSYFAGSTDSRRGPWLTPLDEIFGVRHNLRYGLVDPIDEDVVTFEFLEDLGEIKPGDVLSFRARRHALRPGISARGTHRCQGARRRRGGTSGAAAALDRGRRDGAVHVPDRTHGGAPGRGEPRGHLASVLGVGVGRRRLETASCPRSAGAHRPHPHGIRADRRVRQLLERRRRHRAAHDRLAEAAAARGLGEARTLRRLRGALRGLCRTSHQTGRDSMIKTREQEEKEGGT